jgi:hypothetical protein
LKADQWCWRPHKFQGHPLSPSQLARVIMWFLKVIVSTSTHQCTIHPKPITVHLWMNHTTMVPNLLNPPTSSPNTIAITTLHKSDNHHRYVGSECKWLPR